MPQGCDEPTGGNGRREGSAEARGADELGMSLGLAILAADAMGLPGTRAALAAALRCLDAEAPGADWLEARPGAER